MGADYGTSNDKVIKMGDVLQLVQDSNNYGNDVVLGPLSEKLANGYTLATNAIVDDYTLVLTDATGFIVGTLFKMEELIDGVPNAFYATVLNVVTNTITLDRPIDKPFTALAIINRENFDMSDSDGSTTPVIFSYVNNFVNRINITRLMLNMVTTNATPYNGFGDIASPGLTRGIEVRKKNADGTYKNYFNAKTNNRLDLLMFDLAFFDPTHPQAVNGLGGRFTFEKLGSPVILEQGEELQMLIQDNFTTSTILSFESVAEGNRED